MNEEPYSQVTSETAILLNECVGLEFPSQKGEVNVKVCKAVEGIKEEGRLEGRLEGEENLRQAVSNLMKNLKMNFTQAMEVLGIPQSEWEKYGKA